MSRRTAVVVAPFWGQTGHVGVYRVDRFVRWLAAAGVHVVLVRGGTADEAHDTRWGVEVVVRDPLGLYRQGTVTVAATAQRRPSALRRAAAHLVLVPDPTIAWAVRAAGHPLVGRHAAGASWVISSSPPEAAHVAAGRIARATGAALVIDLRDGWLDDPLRPLLRRPGPRRAVEAVIEGRLVRDAHTVFVTSDVWRDLLVARRPDAAGRTVVLTNGYPPDLDGGEPPRTSGRLSLLHAGRFSASRLGQSVDALLATLWTARAERADVDVSLLGALEPSDLAEAGRWRSRFADAGWTLTCEPPISRTALYSRYAAADGLLLLAASRAAVPSKLFEYLPTRRPILAVTPVDGAVYRVVRALPQVFATGGAASPDASAAAAAFLRACATEVRAAVPPDYSEEALSARFLAALQV